MGWIKNIGGGRRGGVFSLFLLAASGYNFFTGAVMVVKDVAIAPGIWFGLMVASGVWLFLCAWPLHKWLTKSGRFRLLAEEMMEVVSAHQENCYSDGRVSYFHMSAETSAKAETLANKMGKFGIYPPETRQGQEWYRWLPKMVGCATAGNLCKAKKITSEQTWRQ